jgi:hypothetical protein
MLVDDLRMRSFEFWYEFWDIVNLSIVVETRADFTKTNGLVTIVPTILEIGSILQLLFSRELEQLSPNSELPVNNFLTESKVSDVKEACGLCQTLRGSFRFETIPILSIASNSCFASISFPPGVSKFERSRVARSAQSTLRSQL